MQSKRLWKQSGISTEIIHHHDKYGTFSFFNPDGNATRKIQAVEEYEEEDFLKKHAYSKEVRVEQESNANNEDDEEPEDDEYIVHDNNEIVVGLMFT